MPMKKTAVHALVFCLALVLSSPAAARAQDDSARTAVQKHNLKQSRRDMKRMQKEQKKERKAAAATKKSH
jgi:hypothetical protein